MKIGLFRWPGPIGAGGPRTGLTPARPDSFFKGRPLPPRRGRAAMLKVRQRKGLYVVLAAALAAALLVWIPIVGRFSLEDPQPVPVRPSAIHQDPSSFLGRRVTVEGEVRRIYGPRAFLLERGTAAEGPLLVVGRKPWTLLQKNPQVNELIRNDRVQVTGRVRKFKLSEFQEESGRHAADSLLASFEGRPVVLAFDIELTPGVPDYFPGPRERQRAGGSGEDGDSPDSVRSGGADTLRPGP